MNYQDAVRQVPEETYIAARDRLFAALDNLSARIVKAKNGVPRGEISYKGEDPARRILAVTAGFPPDDSTDPIPMGFCREWFRVRIVPALKPGEVAYMAERFAIDNMWFPEPDMERETVLSLPELLSVIVNRCERMQFDDDPERVIAASAPRPGQKPAAG